ncbi:MAG: GspJ family T2SS minor pseudopilin variant LspJ [Tatlockia sp.]|jgi:general secretion pathway protein J
MTKNKGFTLIEILIALAVFAILATISSSAMYYAFTTRSRVTAQADKINSLQLALLFIQRDTEQLVLRTVRTDHLAIKPIFIGEPQFFEATRAGNAVPGNQYRQSTLERIALLCQNNQLIRRKWLSLDTIDKNQYLDKTLLSDVQECHFSYLNSTLQSLKEWRVGALLPNQKPEPFPKAIQLHLTLKGAITLSYLFIIPEALYAEIP